MRLDVGLYKVSKEIGQKWYLEKGHKDQMSAISNLSLLTGVPCIVSAIWIGEIENWSPFFINSIVGLIKFYGYTEILGIPEGFPYDLIKSQGN